jgi:hypothetical protein
MKLDTHESDDNDKIHQNAENIDLFYLLEENNSTIQPIEDKEQTFLQQIDWNFFIEGDTLNTFSKCSSCTSDTSIISSGELKEIEHFFIKEHYRTNSYEEINIVNNKNEKK